MQQQDNAPDGDAPDSTTPSGGSAKPPRRRRRWRLVGWSAAALVVAVLALGGWLAVDTLTARDALQQAAGSVAVVVDGLQDDPAAAQAAITDLQTSAGRAVAATSGPHWTIAGWLPWVGPNTRALQEITSSVDALADSALPGLAGVAQTLSPDRLVPREGRFDVAALRAAAEPVATADATIAGVQQRFAGIDRGELVQPLAQAVDQLAGQLQTARTLTSSATLATGLLPSLLGADGPRNWLVLAQNNAETRATGGIPAALTLLRAHDGGLTIVDQRSSGHFAPFEDPVLPITADEQRLFGDKPARYLQDINLTPDFPRTAALAGAMWQAEAGSGVDVVVSLDPVALQALLAATGPIEFTDPLGGKVRLTGENTATFLLSGVYASYQRQDVQDAVFALAAQAVFARLMSGDVDPAGLLGAVSQIAGQGRLLVWSADPDEQARLEQAGVSGALRGTAQEGSAPQLGVFANLTTSSKTGYYLDLAAEVTTVAEHPDGSRELELTATLTNRLAAGELDALPPHVTWGAPKDGQLRLNLLVYGPTGGSLEPTSPELTGMLVSHDGLPVSGDLVRLPAGETLTLSWRVVVPASLPGQPVLRVTPAARTP